MSLVVSWLLFPLVLRMLTLGCGLLLAAAQAFRSDVCLGPLGFAVIVVVSLITTNAAGTAHLTTPIVVALAIGGFPSRCQFVYGAQTFT